MIYNYFAITDVLEAASSYCDDVATLWATLGLPSDIYLTDAYELSLAWDYDVVDQDGSTDLLSLWCRIRRDGKIVKVHIPPVVYRRIVRSDYTWRQSGMAAKLVEGYHTLRDHWIRVRPEPLRPERMDPDLMIRVRNWLGLALGDRP